MEHPQNADLLRPFDLESAKAGAPVQILGRASKLTYVAGPDSAGKYIFTVPDGRFTRPESCEGERLRMVPLFWVEGRPVYKGDPLWYEGTAPGKWVIADHPSERLGWTTCDDGCHRAIEYMDWEQPKPKTEKVRLLAYLTLTGALIWRDARGEGGDDYRRVPGEDKEVEVVL